MPCVISTLDALYLHSKKKKHKIRETPAREALAFPAREVSPLETFQKEFDDLSEAVRATIETAFDKQFPDQPHYGREAFATHWLENFTIPLSDSLLGRYKKNTVFSLGQSPAWLLEIGRLRQSNPDRLRHIAFSKNWFGLFDNLGKEHTIVYEGPEDIRKGLPLETIDIHQKLTQITEDQPSRTQIAHYRRYLEGIGCHPLHILSQETPTVFIDFVQRGAGIRSFLDLLFQWATELGIDNDEFKKKIILNFIYQESTVKGLCGERQQYESYLTNNFSSLGMLHFTPLLEEGGMEMSLSSLFNKTDQKRRLVRRIRREDWNESLTSSYIEIHSSMRLIYFQIFQSVKNKKPDIPK